MSFLFPHTQRAETGHPLLSPFRGASYRHAPEMRLQRLEQLKTDTGPPKAGERGTRLPSRITAFKSTYSLSPQCFVCFTPFVVAVCFHDCEYIQSQPAITTPWNKKIISTYWFACMHLFEKHILGTQTSSGMGKHHLCSKQTSQSALPASQKHGARICQSGSSRDTPRAFQRQRSPVFMQKKLWCLKELKERKRSSKKYNRRNLFSKTLNRLSVNNIINFLSKETRLQTKHRTQLFWGYGSVSVYKISKHSQDDHFSFQKGESGSTDMTCYCTTWSHQSKQERGTVLQTLSCHSLAPTPGIKPNRNARTRFPGVSWNTDLTQGKHLMKFWCPHHTPFVPQWSWSLPAMLYTGHTSFWTDHLMTGPIYKTEWWKLIRMQSVIPHFWKVRRNLLFQALLTLQCFKIHTASIAEAHCSYMGCKSISAPLGHSSKGFLDFNNHWKMHCYYLQLHLDHCIEKGEQLSSSAQGLHKDLHRGTCLFALARQWDAVRLWYSIHLVRY